MTRLAPDSSKRIPLGPTGREVAANVKRLRGSKQFKNLASDLEDLGRPIPTLGLRRIEAGERRVDVDDLVALALAFGVSPLTLLLPHDAEVDLASRVTGTSTARPHRDLWLWARGDEPLPETVNPESVIEDVVRFRKRSTPHIDTNTMFARVRRTPSAPMA